MTPRTTPLALLALALPLGCGDDAKAPVTDAEVTDTADTTPPTDTIPADTTPPADTAPADTTPPADTVSPDPGHGLCVGLISSCTDRCTTSTCFDACLISDADTAAETTAATAYLGCVDTNDCERPPGATQAQIRGTYQCEQTHCLAERRACEQGQSSGINACGPIGGCLDDCLEDDFTCQRACFIVATVEAARLFLDLQYCVAANCFVVDGSSADYQTCALFALGDDGPCEAFRDSCYGDSSALQGIAFRPVAGKLPPNPW